MSCYGIIAVTILLVRSITAAAQLTLVGDHGQVSLPGCVPRMPSLTEAFINILA